MRTSNGFDRVSTTEELNQVLAVLGEFARGAWMVPGEGQAGADEDESLAEFFINTPELKN
jgi:hypothetical protein